MARYMYTYVHVHVCVSPSYKYSANSTGQPWRALMREIQKHTALLYMEMCVHSVQYIYVNYVTRNWLKQESLAVSNMHHNVHMGALYTYSTRYSTRTEHTNLSFYIVNLVFFCVENVILLVSLMITKCWKRVIQTCLV